MTMFSIIIYLFTAISHPHSDTTLLKKDPPSVDKTLMLQLVNKVRKQGCKCGSTYYAPTTDLTWNDKLEKAALNHTKDMFSNKYFSHVEGDGSSPGQRISDVGYHWRNYGENIAMGYNNETEVVEGWVKSPGHCKNIMSPDYKEMGAARVAGYWTQDFGSK